MTGLRPRPGVMNISPSHVLQCQEAKLDLCRRGNIVLILHLTGQSIRALEGNASLNSGDIQDLFSPIQTYSFLEQQSA